MVRVVPIHMALRYLTVPGEESPPWTPASFDVFADLHFCLACTREREFVVVVALGGGHDVSMFRLTIGVVVLHQCLSKQALHHG